MEHLSTFANQSTDEPKKQVSSSAATTVLRRATNIKVDHRSSNSSDETFRRHSVDPNHQVLTNRHGLDGNYRATSISNPFHSTNSFHNNYNGQRVLITSGDIEAMTMKQFQMGSLGC